MAIDEESRHRLYGRLEAVLGQHEATTLMEMVRPQGWSDLATKADLELLEARLGVSISKQINQALTTQTRTLIVSNASMLAGVAAIAAILAR